MKHLVARFSILTSILAVLTGCASILSSDDTPLTVSLKQQCYEHATRSLAHCEFMNQGNPEGLTACRQSKFLADNRCERLAD